MGLQTCNVRSYDASAAGPIMAHALGLSRPDSASSRPGIESIVVLEQHDDPQGAVVAALAGRPSKRGRPPKATTGFVLGGLDSWRALTAAGRSPEEVRDLAVRFGRDALAWWKQRFPHSVVLASAIHMDESTPHLHVVSVMRDETGRVGSSTALPGAVDLPTYGEDGKPIRYSAKARARQMSQLHDSYQAEVCEKYGVGRGEVGKSRNEFRTPSTRIARQERAAEEAIRQAQTAQKEAEAETARVQDVLQEKLTLDERFQQVVFKEEELRAREKVLDQWAQDLEKKVSALEQQTEQLEADFAQRERDLARRTQDFDRRVAAYRKEVQDVRQSLQRRAAMVPRTRANREATTRICDELEMPKEGSLVRRSLAALKGGVEDAWERDVLRAFLHGSASANGSRRRRRVGSWRKRRWIWK